MDRVTEILAEKGYSPDEIEKAAGLVMKHLGSQHNQSSHGGGGGGSVGEMVKKGDVRVGQRVKSTFGGTFGRIGKVTPESVTVEAGGGASRAKSFIFKYSEGKGYSRQGESLRYAEEGMLAIKEAKMDRITELLIEKGYSPDEIEKAKGGLGQWVRDKIGRFASKPGGGGSLTSGLPGGIAGWKRSVSGSGNNTRVRYRGTKDDWDGKSRERLFSSINRSMTKAGWKSSGRSNSQTGHGRSTSETYRKGRQNASVTEYGMGDVEVTFY